MGSAPSPCAAIHACNGTTRIQVACKRAAYVAGASKTEIDEELLRSTIERMYRKRGNLSSVGPPSGRAIRDAQPWRRGRPP